MENSNKQAGVPSYEQIKKYFGKDITYDNMGQYIWAVQNDGHHQKVADLRGWGGIQQLFRNKDGSIRTDEAAEFQDKIGAFIVEAIKEKLSPPPKSEAESSCDYIFDEAAKIECKEGDGETEVKKQIKKILEKKTHHAYQLEGKGWVDAIDFDDAKDAMMELSRLLSAPSKGKYSEEEREKRIKMRKDASNVFELTKGFTAEPTDNAMKTALEMAHYVMVLTNDLDGEKHGNAL